MTSPAPQKIPAELADEGDALVRIIRGRARLRQLNDTEVHAAVERYARCARRLGIPPERLLVALKELLFVRALHDVGGWYRSVLADRMIVWAIEGYYRLDGELESESAVQQTDRRERGDGA